MATTARAVGAGVLVVVLAAGAYTTADAYDVVPGVLTLAPVPDPPAPFPTAPGAVEPTAPAPALAELDPQAPIPAADPVQALVDDLVADRRMSTVAGGTLLDGTPAPAGTRPPVGVVVVDDLTGETLAEHLPDEGRTPASTAKLATAVAALDRLGPDVTLPTRVVRGPDDQVVLVGGGDMMLAADAGDPDAVVGHAGLGDLATQTAAALVREGVGSVRVVVDDSLFSGPLLSPTWAQSDVNAGFVAPVTALAVDIAKIRPGEYPPRQTDPSLSAARVFAERLAAAGVTVQGSPTRGTAPEGATPLAEVRSAPLGEIVHYMLDTSDNTIAEVVSRLVALEQGLPASFQGGTQAVLHVVSTLGVDTAGARLSDASGLGAGSALSPRTVAGLVRLTTGPQHPVLRAVATGMPIGGLTGTLADRYGSSAARGLVRAKTGSLPHVTGLAGTVVDADGRRLVFAVLADGTPDGGQPAPRAAIDAFVTALAGCGCR